MLFALVLAGLLAPTPAQIPLVPVTTESNRPAGPANTILVFVSQHLFNDQEFEAVTRTIAHSGIYIQVTAPDTGVAVGMNGMMVLPNITLDRVETSDYAGLVLVGGSGTVLVWTDTLLHERCREFAREGKVVAAIGIAPLVLARAGLLDGRLATVHSDRHAITDLRAHGARYNFKSLVRDGRIVTAAGIDRARDFALTVAGLVLPGPK